MSSSASQRHAQLAELLQEELFLDIRALTERFQVSVATIRRDLGEMEEAGLLRRTHGGAVSVNQVMQDAPHAARAVARQKEKAAIAVVAAGMIADGDAVLLDAGTTSFEVAKILAGRKNLTFISNGADIVTELIRAGAQNIYSVGGEYTSINNSFLGPLAEEFIQKFNVDKLIINASSIDIDRGLICTGSPANASVQRAMMKVSNRVIVVADYSKFTKTTLSVTAKIEEVGVIVTDAGAQSIIDRAPEKLRKKFVIANEGRKG